MRRRPLPTKYAAIGFAAALFFICQAVAAPPEVASFFPTGVQRGQSAEIVASGKFDNWPPSVWTEHPGLSIEPAADKGKLKVVCSADASPGIHWVRLIDGEGASPPRPLLVGILPEVVEQEPNDEPAKPQTIQGSQVVSGKLAKRGDVDTFAVQLTAGQTLVADLIANEILGSPMDGVLQLCSSSGQVLRQQHDTRGLDPRIVFTASHSETYLVRLFAFPASPDSSINFAGGDGYVYRLTVTTGPFADHALPLAIARGAAADLTLAGQNLTSPGVRLEPAVHYWRDRWFWHPPEASGFLPLLLVDHPSLVVEQPASGTVPPVVPVPVTLTGWLAAPQQQNVVAIAATTGQKVEIQVEASSLGYDLDPVVTIADSSGKMVAEADDGRRNERDVRLEFNPAADGQYLVTIRDLHGRGGSRQVYRCTIRHPAPDFSLSLSGGSFRVAAGATVEVPVLIDRQGGFKSAIEIMAEHLPAGVTAAAVTSPAEGEQAKQVKLLLTAAADAQSGSFHIIGKAADDQRPARFATFETTLGESKFLHRDIWIAVGRP